jgi:hypothetical protein
VSSPADDIVLYRAMIADSDELPVTGPTARTLGVRPSIDITVDGLGWVDPGSGGMSVAPNDPMYLPRHRRPPEMGGTGKDPIWSIRVSDLSRSLVFRSDPFSPSVHGFVEPAVRMIFEEFQSALADSRRLWQRRHH